MAQVNLDVALRTFSAETIAKEKWFRTPVKVELLDITMGGMGTVYEMEVRKEDDQSTCEFSQVRSGWQAAGVSPREPFTVRFTYEGKTVDMEWNLPVS